MLMKTSEKSRGTFYQTFYLNVTVNVFNFFFIISIHYYLSAYIIVSFTAHSALESVLYYMNVPCDQHKEFMSAARTPVTNHVFHCTLPFSLIMSNSDQNTPPHHHRSATLC